jgi:hypothetical protein
LNPKKTKEKDWVPRLRGVGDMAQKYGVTVILETHPPLFPNGDVGIATMQKVNHPAIRINYDTANMYFYNENIDAIAVTQGPGLVGSLLVGIAVAKSIAYVLKIPWVGVDHIFSHISAIFPSVSSLRFPFIALVVSGGHTSLFRIESHTQMILLGRTLDDAAGEALAAIGGSRRHGTDTAHFERKSTRPESRKINRGMRDYSSSFTITRMFSMLSMPRTSG